MCLVGTRIVDVLILRKHRHAFCQLKNSRRLFIVKSKVNTPSVVDENNESFIVLH